MRKENLSNAHTYLWCLIVCSCAALNEVIMYIKNSYLDSIKSSTYLDCLYLLLFTFTMLSDNLSMIKIN